MTIYYPQLSSYVMNYIFTSMEGRSSRRYYFTLEDLNELDSTMLAYKNWIDSKSDPINF